MSKNSNKLKQADMFKLGDLLRQHCKVLDGFAVYDEGFDDARILSMIKQLHPDVSVNINNVSGLRKALMGNVRVPRVGKVDVAELLARLERLETWAAARPVQGFKKS